jgi:hypothetical protein
MSASVFIDVRDTAWLSQLTKALKAELKRTDPTDPDDWRLIATLDGAIITVAEVAARGTKKSVFAAYDMLSALPFDVSRRVPTDAREFNACRVTPQSIF